VKLNTETKGTRMKKMMVMMVGSMCAVQCATVALAAEEGAAPKPAKKEAGAPQDQRMVVAVDKFENKADAPSALFNTLRNRITSSIINTRKFQVVEREQLKSVLSEIKLAEAGVTDENLPEKKLKAAGYVIYGTVLFLGMDENTAQVGGVGAMKTTARVEIELRFSSAETGKILSSKTVNGANSQSRMASEGTSTRGNVEEQAINSAIVDAAQQVTDALMDLTFPAKILAVSKTDITLNLTQEQVQEDDLFDVFSLGDELKDPDTGESLGAEEERVGRVRISRPGPKFSKAEPDGDLETDDLKVGMLVRRVSKAAMAKEQKKVKAKKAADFESRF
jgi:curli biogenesis system outer membrane secretion channel CsgG